MQAASAGGLAPPMKPAQKCVLTLNGGSSSIKFALYEIGGALRRLCSGRIERIGIAGTTFTVKGATAAENVSRKITARDHGAAVEILRKWMEANVGAGVVVAMGHRVVHGGPKYSAPHRVDRALLKELHRLVPFDPQHLPGEIQLIEALQKEFPRLPQIACFDTAFHHDLPNVARLLAIPRRYAAKGVRRYGFHGLSYTFLMGELARVAGKKAAHGRVVLAHLGNGASLAAVHQGRPMDTSMAFTPTAGVPMSTRSGDLDPALGLFFAQTENMTTEQFNDMVNFKSGLLGLSETSSDMRDLLQREGRDSRAAEAVAHFCYHVKKFIGSYAAALGGLDTLVFAGGIGENNPEIRWRICDNLTFLGIKLDKKRNAANAGLLSAVGSRVAVRLIHTDEESVIARSVCGVLGVKLGKD